MGIGKLFTSPFFGIFGVKSDGADVFFISNSVLD